VLILVINKIYHLIKLSIINGLINAMLTTTNHFIGTHKINTQNKYTYNLKCVNLNIVGIILCNFDFLLSYNLNSI